MLCGHVMASEVLLTKSGLGPAVRGFRRTSQAGCLLQCGAHSSLVLGDVQAYH